MLEEMAQAAAQAARVMACATTEQKNHALGRLSALVLERQEAILTVNRQDLEAGEAMGLDAHMLDRLSLDGRLQGIAADIEAILAYPDPIGEVFDERTLPNGLCIVRCRTPIGVLGVIYEARPNVTLDIAALAIKTGNAAIMRGGKEALRTNLILAQAVEDALDAAGLPKTAIQLVATPAREQVAKMLRLHDSIDLIIPRGGAGLHAFCRKNSTIPVITGGIGVCHLYVDDSVAIDGVIPVVINAKVQRPTVCNSLDTVLVHRALAHEFLLKFSAQIAAYGVTFSCDAEALELLKGHPARLAALEDWDTEWLSLVLGVRIVGGIDEAIAHIQQHSSGHSDGILTESSECAHQFVRAVDSAVVYVNASTRYTDGAQFGLGAEVAVSTQKLHARGPMGVREITSYKWVVHGQNHVRE